MGNCFRFKKMPNIESLFLINELVRHPGKFDRSSLVYRMQLDPFFLLSKKT